MLKASFFFSIFVGVGGELGSFGLKEGLATTLADKLRQAGDVPKCCSSSAVGGIEDYPHGNPRCGELEEGACDIMEREMKVPPSPGRGE
jgi:hypothetical protein